MIYSSLPLFKNAGNSTSRFDGGLDELDQLEDLDINKKFLYRKSEDARDNETEVQIPLVSKISGYIEQKKLEVQQLDINKKKLLQEKEELEEQNNTILSNITNLKRKENLSVTYLTWFNSLKKELWDIYNIKLEKEFSNFVKVFTDFKYYGYDAHQIVNEYRQIESLRNEMKHIQRNVDLIKKLIMIF